MSNATATVRYEELGVEFINKKMTVIAGSEGKASAFADRVEALANVAKAEFEDVATKPYKRKLAGQNYRRAMKDVAIIRSQI